MVFLYLKKSKDRHRENTILVVNLIQVESLEVKVYQHYWCYQAPPFTAQDYLSNVLPNT